MQKKMTQLQAYNAMAKLFQIYYELDSSGDLCEILGVMSFLQDKKTVDMYMFEDWIKCLDSIFVDKNLHNYNHITILQAFFAIGLFLKNFFRTDHLAFDIKFLEQNTNLAKNNGLIDPILWKNWLQCVDKVLSMKDSRMYFGSSKNK